MSNSASRTARPRSAVAKLFANHPRLWIAAGLGVGVYLLLPGHWSTLGRVVAAWNGAVIVFVPAIFLWAMGCSAEQIRRRYAEVDPAAPVILLIVVAGALVSVVAIVALLADLKALAPPARIGHISLAGLTIVDSWFLVPTMFTLHYADAFYSAPEDKPPLKFPGTARPTFWDFAYFSFTIAVACQTADVSTLQTRIRRTVTAHAVISFFFNAAILGFAINVSAGMVGAG